MKRRLASLLVILSVTLLTVPLAAEAQPRRPRIGALMLYPPSDNPESPAHRVCEEIGLRALLAHCHARLAKLCRRTGIRQEADEHFTTATTMYREMGATW